MTPLFNDRHDDVRSDIVELIPALRAFARTFCRNANDVDDLVQETLMKALGNVDKFQRGTRLKSWMFTIMRNTFYTKAKYTSRERPGNKSCVAEGLSREATQDWSVRGQELVDAMGHLPDHYREILVMVVIEGASYADAAEASGCAVGTVKSRLNRARHLIIEELDDHV